MDTTSGGMVPPSNGTFDQGGSQSNDLNKLEGKASDFVSSGYVLSMVRFDLRMKISLA
ncbi:hypothetical protein D8B26_005713 [Coccidioides posadasii str. Silveira]|uniref:uncharacterized protein n=1 Tax=Coccidioides posadasii (strain RMSCC 757 / Silveira) TaxID=443226 RepID=UPI001BEDA826|nr:hypothetical protein D8B26_005713 [Coccidioides posadasii str. Silveira]